MLQQKVTFEQDFEAAGRFYNVVKRRTGISEEGNLMKSHGPTREEAVDKEQRCGDSGEHRAEMCRGDEAIRD